MSIYNKPLSQIGTDDLQELLTEGAVENARLEFKLEVPAKDETLKKLSSFANTFGGYLVVGAKASSADGRLDALPGVDMQAGYKQKIVQWCFEATAPPLNAEVSDPIQVPGGIGKVCYVIFIAESDLAPHFINGRKGIYVRTDEFSSRFEARLAVENELRNLFDRRKLILERRDRLLERARTRFQTYIQQRSVPSNPRVPARLELSVSPRFPARPICEQGLLAPLVQTRVQWRQRHFPKAGSGVASQFESAITLDPVADFTGDISIFEANVWGLLYYGTQLESNENGTVGIHLYRAVGCVLLFLHHANEIIQRLSFQGPVLVNVALDSVRGKHWLHAPEGMLVETPGSQLDDNVAFSIDTTTEVLREKYLGVTVEVLRYIFYSLNCPQLIDSSDKIEELVRKGYKFNFWREPTNLGL